MNKKPHDVVDFAAPEGRRIIHAVAHEPSGIDDSRNAVAVRAQSVLTSDAQSSESGAVSLRERNREMRNMIEELKSGKIPQSFYEEYRLVPADSPEGIAFNNTMQTAVRKLYTLPEQQQTPTLVDYLTHHDFDAEPVRFMLSDHPFPNAYSVNYANPPLIVLTKALFKEQNFLRDDGVQVKERIVNTPDELRVIIGHEMTHAKLGIKFGHERSNSKFEEGAAQGIPSYLLHTANCNPRAVLWLSQKMHQTNGGQRPELLAAVLDAHPLPRTEKSILESSLAALHNQRGDFSHMQSSAPFSTTSPLLSSIKAAHHVTYVESKMPADYESKPPIEKIAILKDILIGLDSYLPIRLNAIASAFFVLEGKVDPAEATALVDECAEYVLTLSESIGYENCRRLYYSLSSIAHPNEKGKFPIGRLKKIQAVAERFVSAGLARNTEAIDVAAEELLVVVGAEKCLATDSGQKFLQSLRWPQFTLPTGLAKYDGGDVQTTLAVSWNPVLERARTNPTVLRAALCMGIPVDPTLLVQDPDNTEAQIIFSHTEGMLNKFDFLLKPLNKESAESPLQPFSTGPVDATSPAFDFDSARLLLDKKGRVTQVLSPDALAKIRYNMCCEYIQHLLRKSCDALKTATEEDRPGRQEAHDDFIETIVSYTTSARLHHLFVEDLFAEEPRVFFEANNISSCDEERVTLLMPYVMKCIKSEPYRTALRGLFGIDPGTQKVDQKKSSSLFLQRSLSGISLPEHHDRSSDFGSHLFFFLLAEKGILFSPVEKAEIINSLLLQGRKHVSGEYQNARGESKPPKIEVSPRDATQLCPRLDACALAVGLPTVGKINDIHKLTALVEQHAKNPQYGLLVVWMCLLRVVELNNVKKPSISGFASFLEATAPYLRVKFFETQVKDFINTSLSLALQKAPLNEAVKIWCIYKDNQYLTADVVGETLDQLTERIKSEQAATQVVVIQTLLMGRYIEKTKNVEALVDILVDATVAEHGIDDGTDEYEQKLKPFVAWVSTHVKRLYQQMIFSALARKSVAQANTTYAFYNAMPKVTATDLNTKTAMIGVGVDAFWEYGRRNPNDQKRIIEFFSESFHEDTAGGLFDDMKATSIHMQGYIDPEGKNEESARRRLSSAKEKRIEEKSDKAATAYMKHAYENFWTAPFEVRIAFFKELLVSDDSPGMNDDLIEFVCSLAFKGDPEETKYIRDYVRAYVAVSPEYMQVISLAALIAAAEKSRDSTLPLGQAIALFAEKVGPAETKVVQIAEGHPDVPVELRKDLGRLKYAANEPERWNVHEQIDGLESELLDSYMQLSGHDGVTIERRGRVLGSGSLFVAIEVFLSDGTQHVLAMQRPYSLERGKTGFNSLGQCIEKLGSDHPIVTTLQDLVEMAHGRLDVETNCEVAPLQYDTAYELYKNTDVEVDGVIISATTPRLTAHGKTFFMMERMEGTHFAQLPDQTEDDIASKNRLSRALVFKELCNIFRGTFDSDRHGGNVKVHENSLNHFDFKGMMISSPTKQNLENCAHIFARGFEKMMSGEDLLTALLSSQREYRAETGDADVYVGEVMKALVSLGEYVRLMSQEQRMEVFVAALQACRYEPFVVMLQEEIPMIAGLMSAKIDSIRVVGE